MARSLTLGILKLHRTQLAWHWALGVADTFYEVEATTGFDLPMSVLGPDGILASSSSSPIQKRSHRRGDFTGLLELDQGTDATDDAILDFIHGWVQQHPRYNVATLNCQHFVADFYRFLTGAELPYRKDTDKLMGLGRLSVVALPMVAFQAAAERIPDATMRQGLHKYSLPSASDRVLWQIPGHSRIMSEALAVDVVALRTAHNTFVSATPDGWFSGGNVVTAGDIRAWEVFTLYRMQDGICHLKTQHDTWLKAPPGDGARFTTAEVASGWECFWIEEDPAGRTHLRSFHQTYLSAPPGVGKSVVAAPCVRGAWEVLQIVAAEW